MTRLERRCQGERGSGAVIALVVVASSLGGVLIWMTGDVDRSVSLGGTAQIVAFEAARIGAQQVDVDQLRHGVVDTVTLDRHRARTAVLDAVAADLDRRAMSGVVLDLVVTVDSVTVVVGIDHAGRRVTGRGGARAVIGP